MASKVIHRIPEVELALVAIPGNCLSRVARVQRGWYRCPRLAVSALAVRTFSLCVFALNLFPAGGLGGRSLAMIFMFLRSESIRQFLEKYRL